SLPNGSKRWRGATPSPGSRCSAKDWSHVRRWPATARRRLAPSPARAFIAARRTAALSAGSSFGGKVVGVVVMEQQLLGRGRFLADRLSPRHIHKFFHGFLNDEGVAGYTLDERF